MKLLNIKPLLTGTATAFIMVTGFYSCTIDELVDPNNPSLEGIEADATVSELNNLVTGMEAGMRPSMDTYLDCAGIAGRDFYRFSGADPRFTSELLGKGESELDNNTFYVVNPWASRYRVVTNGWILRHAIANTTADLTVEEKSGYLGFAKTIQAYQMLLNLNMTYNGGIRLNTEDPDNLGPFTGYHESLEGIAALLDEAANDLSNAGTEFRFSLSGGFAGFNTPETFRQFNRGLMARVMLYHEDYAGALSALGESFLNASGDLGTGTWNVYSSGAGDILNPLFYPLNSAPGGNARCAHNSWVADAEAGDTRLSKAVLRDEPAFQDDLTSDYDVWVWQSSDAPICIMRNEELVLIDAEAKARTGDAAGAVLDINVVRASAGLAAYAGGMTEGELVDEILNQRRYSLFAEGHRWIDMRRTGKLGELPIDRPDDDVWEQFPIPYDEGQ